MLRCAREFGLCQLGQASPNVLSRLIDGNDGLDNGSGTPQFVFKHRSPADIGKT